VNGRTVAGRVEETKIGEGEGETAVVGERHVYWRRRGRKRKRERDRVAAKERWTATRARVGRRKRVVRRRLVCGAFTGVGPSFILPLQSVNTYPPVCVRVTHAHAHVASMHNACVMYAHRSARIPLRAHCLRTMTRKPAMTTVPIPDVPTTGLF